MTPDEHEAFLIQWEIDAAKGHGNDPLPPFVPRHDALIKGLRKAVASDETVWVDANIIRLLLDRYDRGPE